MPHVINLTELREIDYLHSINFKLDIVDNNKTYDFQCSHITRCLPGKRISCIGQWKQQQVFAKFFISSGRAKVHWEKEKSGFDLLHHKKIASPIIIHEGKHHQSDIYFIFFQFINNTNDLQSIWDNSHQTDQLKLLNTLTTTVAEHHNKGILQKDLHLNNFLLSKDQLYTLDGADIVSFDFHDKQKASDNIALLFAQFHPSNDQYINASLTNYAALRKWDLTPQLLKHINDTTLSIRNKRKEELLAKTQRSCSLFYFKHTWKQLTICSRKYRSNEMERFFQSPDDFINQGTLLKQGNTCTVAIITIDGIKRVVKRYNIKNWKHALSRALRPTRATTSWSNAHLLQFYGISTPEPIAIIEKRWGPVRKTAYFVSELSEGETADIFFQSSTVTDQQLAAQSLVKLIQSFHRLNISHGDLKITNFIISNLQASIIDLDSMKQHSSLYFFNKAKTKDLKRFFKNWTPSSSLESLFKKTFSHK